MTQPDNRIPDSEQTSYKGPSKWFFYLADKAGLATGIVIVAWGVGWLIWSLGNYLVAPCENDVQMLIMENYSNQNLLAAILIAQGILIMEVKKRKL